jgi:[NiFe] hydrogenase assembly HybE family chaperone
MHAVASPEPDESLNESVKRLAARYREIAATTMADVPICNAALGVEALGFRRWSGRALGMVVTPWFLNLTVFDAPDAEPAPPASTGATIPLALPAGEVQLIVGELPGFGRVDICSLFSPMFEFADMAAAVETAREALRALLAPPSPPPGQQPKPAFDRRAFLRGALAPPGQAPA